MFNEAPIVVPKAVANHEAAKLLKAYQTAVVSNTELLSNYSDRDLKEIQVGGLVYTNPEFILGVKAGMAAAAAMFDSINAAFVIEGEDDE